MNKVSFEFKIGFILVGIYLLWGMSYPILQSWNVIDLNKNIETELVQPFHSSAMLGTDMYGRALFSVLTAGVAYSLLFAMATALMQALIGITVGAITALSKSRLAVLLELIGNAIYIFPTILVAIMVMAMFEGGMLTLFLTLVLAGWPAYARISRSEFLRVKNLPHVESERAIGAGSFHIFRHALFPAILPVIIVQLVLGLSGVIMSESTLGFLGFGHSEYSWGQMLSSAKDVLLEAPHVTVVTSLTMAGIILGLNLLGDGLRDYLDPKS